MVTCIEICAGAGGMALGLETAGMKHTAVVELDPDAANTLRLNRPEWDVLETDVFKFDGTPYHGVDVFAGGVPCPPFSAAGQKLGAADGRDLFPSALRLINELQPRAVIIENVKGLLAPRFKTYRESLLNQLNDMGYSAELRLFDSSKLGMAQRRERTILVALRPEYADNFEWPTQNKQPDTVGRLLHPMMGENGWPGADQWAMKANRTGPTLVGGSHKHGGADLGPSGARTAWAALGVRGTSIADTPPSATDPIDMTPRLTTRMATTYQGFPDHWIFSGRKTAAYRQVGNAFPPPVAEAVGKAVMAALGTRKNNPVKAA